MDAASAAAAAGAGLGAGVLARGRAGGPGRRDHARPHPRAAEHRLRLARQPARSVWTLLLIRW